MISPGRCCPARGFGVCFVIVRWSKSAMTLLPNLSRQIEAMGVGLARVVEGIEIGDGAGRQDALKLAPNISSRPAPPPESPPAGGAEDVHVELASHQLGQHVGLEELQAVGVVRGQLNENGACRSGSRLRCMEDTSVTTSCRLLSAVTVCWRSVVLLLLMRFLLAALWMICFSPAVTWRV